MATVIIPAHNEQAVIADTLSSLLTDLPDSVQVVVACNGCTDHTAQAARSVSPRVEVIEIDERSKAAGINAGEAIAGSFPRLVQDADVQLSGRSIALIVDALSASGALMAEPRPRFDLAGSSYPVRAFYRVWLALHGGRPGDIGSGAYGLSEVGRSRFGEYPRIIGDDAYVRAHFHDDEITYASDAVSRIQAPRSTAGLVRIKTRSRLGQWELNDVFPELWGGKRSRTESLLSKASRIPPRVWLDVPTYLGLQVWIRLRAARLYRDFEAYEWERDDRPR